MSLNDPLVGFDIEAQLVDIDRVDCEESLATFKIGRAHV